jgi:hypothetical protein
MRTVLTARLCRPMKPVRLDSAVAAVAVPGAVADPQRSLPAPDRTFVALLSESLPIRRVCAGCALLRRSNDGVGQNEELSPEDRPAISFSTFRDGAK